MLKHNLAMAIMYPSLLYICCKYKDLECKLALKTMECETYKTLIQSAAKKNDKKKD